MDQVSNIASLNAKRGEGVRSGPRRRPRSSAPAMAVPPERAAEDSAAKPVRRHEPDAVEVVVVRRRAKLGQSTPGAGG